jgi:hypothetical protein
MKLSKEKLIKKYSGKYVYFSRSMNWETKEYEYEVIKVSNTIKENYLLVPNHL